MAIEAGSSFVQGMNLQQALDNAIAVDLAAIFAKGSRWRVENPMATIYPHSAHIFKYEEGDTVTFGESLEYSSARLQVGAVGLCAPADLNQEEMNVDFSLRLAARRLLISEVSVQCKTETGCQTALYADRIYGPRGMCPPSRGSPCMSFQPVLVVSASSNEVVLVGTEPMIVGEGNCGKVSILRRL